jgi:Ran GTPase-activating protein (RanGAP) involved in mRNA processing and transport
VLAPAIAVCASVTKILVDWNQLGDEGTTNLCDALRESTVSKVQELSLIGNGIGPDGAKAIAALCAVCASLTKILVGWNRLGNEGATILCDALRESAVVTKVQELDLSNNNIGPEGAKAVAAMAAVVASITSVDLSSNTLRREDKALLSKAVEGRSGFKLKL